MMLCIDKLCSAERVRRSQFNKTYDNYVLINNDREKLRKKMPNFFDIQGEVKENWLSNVSSIFEAGNGDLSYSEAQNQLHIAK